MSEGSKGGLHVIVSVDNVLHFRKLLERDELRARDLRIDPRIIWRMERMRDIWM